LDDFGREAVAAIADLGHRLWLRLKVTDGKPNGDVTIPPEVWSFLCRQLFAGRAVDRFSKACCGTAAELADAATAWMNAREVAQRRVKPSKLMRPEEL
jgi:hypothetical protein